MKPLMIDLYCGLGGWSEGGPAEGYYVVGFDIERHRYPKYATQEEYATQGETGVKVGEVYCPKCNFRWIEK